MGTVGEDTLSGKYASKVTYIVMRQQVSCVSRTGSSGSSRFNISTGDSTLVDSLCIGELCSFNVRSESTVGNGGRTLCWQEGYMNAGA